MDGPRGEYVYETPEERELVERILASTKAPRQGEQTRRQTAGRPGTQVPSAVFMAPIVLALVVFVAATAGLKTLLIIAALVAGPISAVVAARTLSGRVLTGMVVVGMSFGWWTLIEMLDQADVGLGEVGAVVIFGPLLLVPLAATTLVLTVLGVTRLYGQRG